MDEYCEKSKVDGIRVKIAGITDWFVGAKLPIFYRNEVYNNGYQNGTY